MIIIGLSLAKYLLDLMILLSDIHRIYYHSLLDCHMREIDEMFSWIIFQ